MTTLSTAARKETPVDYAAQRRHRRISWRRVLVHLPLAVGAVAMVVPFIFMISTSLNADSWLTIPFPAQLLPHHTSGRAYSIAAQGMDVGRLYLNTFVIAAVQIVISLLSALLSGYALSKIQPRGSRILLLVILATMMIPVESTIIPNFRTFRGLHLLDSYLPFWIPAFAYTFGTFFVKQYLDGLPSDFREAAQLDGSGELRILFSIYLPMTKPVLATCTILIFLDVWNGFLWPLIVLNSPGLYTLQLGISQFSASVGGSTYALPAVNMAATVLSVIPVLAVYFALQRYVVESVANSALKG